MGERSRGSTGARAHIPTTERPHRSTGPHLWAPSDSARACGPVSVPWCSASCVPLSASERPVPTCVGCPLLSGLPAFGGVRFPYRRLPLATSHTERRRAASASPARMSWSSTASSRRRPMARIATPSSPASRARPTISEACLSSASSVADNGTAGGGAGGGPSAMAISSRASPTDFRRAACDMGSLSLRASGPTARVARCGQLRGFGRVPRGSWGQWRAHRGDGSARRGCHRRASTRGPRTARRPCSGIEPHTEGAHPSAASASAPERTTHARARRACEEWTPPGGDT